MVSEVDVPAEFLSRSTAGIGRQERRWLLAVGAGGAEPPNLAERGNGWIWRGGPRERFQRRAANPSEVQWIPRGGGTEC
jgi:hypothetical protein